MPPAMRPGARSNKALQLTANSAFQLSFGTVLASTLGVWAAPEALLAAAERRFVRGRHEIEQTETFSLLAELALGLAGFTGVAATFGGPDRVYSEADRVRLLSIFFAAGCVLVGCLCTLTLIAAGWSAGQSYRWAGLFSAAILIPIFYDLLPHGYAFARDPEASTSVWIFAFALAQVMVSVLLLAGNFIAWEEAWPLFAAFSIQLTWGLFLFSRILTRRN